MNDQVAEAIDRHLAETTGGVSQRKGGVTEHSPGLWRALVAITPDGPLVLMEFGIRARAAA